MPGQNASKTPRRNRYSPLPGPSFTVYAPFRKSRIALRRHLTSVGQAQEFCERVAADRFHDRASLVIVDDHSGEAVDTTRPAHELQQFVDAAAAAIGIPPPHAARPILVRTGARGQLTDVAARLADMDATLARVRARPEPLRMWSAPPASLPPALAERAERCRHSTAEAFARQRTVQAQLEASAARLKRTWEVYVGRPWSSPTAS